MNHWARKFRRCSSISLAATSIGVTIRNQRRAHVWILRNSDATGHAAKYSAAHRLSMAWCIYEAIVRTTMAGRRQAILDGALRMCCRSFWNPKIICRLVRWTALIIVLAAFCRCRSSHIIRHCRMLFCVLDRNWVSAYLWTLCFVRHVL